MARSFSKSDAKKLGDQYRQIRKEYEEREEHQGSRIQAVTEAAVRMREERAAAVLKELPVERIENKEKGIDASLLRAAGYTSLAAISRVTVGELASLRGITEESARVIRRLIQEVEQSVYDSVNIRPEYDSRTPAASALVLSICRYLASVPILNRSHELFEEYDQNVMDAVLEMEAGSRRFIPAEEKERAEEAFFYLKDLTGSEYVKGAKELKDAWKKIGWISEAQAWDDFLEHPEPYDLVLEKLQNSSEASEEADTTEVSETAEAEQEKETSETSE